MKARVLLASLAVLATAVSFSASSEDKPFRPKPVSTWCTDNRADFNQALSEEGYHPVLFLGGTEPFTANGKSRIAVVFLNLHSGTWVLAVAEENDPGVCIIASGKDLSVVDPQATQSAPKTIPPKVQEKSVGYSF